MRLKILSIARDVLFLLVFLIILFFFKGSTQAIQVDAVWIDGAAGNWNTAGNWSGGVVPNNAGGSTYNVKIDNGNTGQNSSVSLNMSATIDNLTIDSGDSLGINTGQTLTLASGAGAGTISNAGSLTLNATTSITQLRVSGGDVSLTGGGTVTLSNNANNRIIGAVSTDRLINVDNTIQGAGNIGGNNMALTNQGLIDANQTNSLTIDSSASGAINTGTMRASSGGTLTLLGGTFTNTGGIIEALTGSQTNISSSTVSGGTLSTSGTGVTNLSSATLDGVTTASGTQVNQANAQSVTVTGGMVNNGTFELNSTGSVTQMTFQGA